MTKQNQPRFRPFLRVPYEYRCFFAEPLELWESKHFTPGVWITSDKVKSTIKNQDTLQIENTKYRVLHKKKNIDASFAEHAKFKNK